MLGLALSILASCGSGGAEESTSTSSTLVVTGPTTTTTSGVQGGSFDTVTADYELECVGTEPVDWSAVCDQGWLVAEPASGELAPGASTTVTVSLNQSVSGLPVGSHGGVVHVFAAPTSTSPAFTGNFTVTVGAPAGSQPMLTANVTTGVAPLAVVFDPIGAGSGVAQPSGGAHDHETFTYRWDFGDPGSGNWPFSGKPRNQSIGWVGAHVYETPGTYLATLQLIDADGNETFYEQTITVTDPSTVLANRTFYVAADGDDTNAGTPTQPFLTVSRALTAVASAGGSGRVRLKRGDTFTLNDALHLGGGSPGIQGPLIVDGYGTETRPRIVFSGQYGGISSGPVAGARIVGLELVGSENHVGVRPGANTLISDCVIRGFNYGSDLYGANGVVYHATEIRDNHDYAIYAYGPNVNEARHMALLGCHLNGSDQHLLRTYVSRSVFQANRLENATVHGMKLCGRPQPNPSNYVCILDNDFQCRVLHYEVAIGPENDTSDQVCEDFLIQGNRFYSRNPGNHALNLTGPFMTVRNNVFDLDNRPGINAYRNGLGPEPHDILIENNTAYGVHTNLRFVTNITTTDQTVVRNNIMFCANGGTVVPPGGTVTASNNLMENPLFTDGPNGDFSLTSQSPAIDTGTANRVRFDFVGNARPVGAGIDRGAFERQ